MFAPDRTETYEPPVSPVALRYLGRKEGRIDREGKGREGEGEGREGKRGEERKREEKRGEKGWRKKG
jgi:hypothetical protein